MARATGDGIEIEYETFGEPSDPALLLVSGLSSQLLGWEAEFCELLAAGGRFVIRYDNRDVGLSTHFDGQIVDLANLQQSRRDPGQASKVPYTLSDMAADGMLVLDDLGIERAHIAGMSMGGMIVQTMAIEHPDRVLTLTSIMSTTGEADYFKSSDEASQVLFAPPPSEREAYIESSVTSAVFCSKRYFDPERAKQRAAEAFDRMFYPEGVGRQIAAIWASGDRADGLRALDVPTLVIHGADDTLIMPPGGLRTAELVPHADLLLLGDMGHDLPAPMWPRIVSAILAHTG
ncbi:MAG: alpha/beta hydrolase [Ilumatobacteraceae bacterium]